MPGLVMPLLKQSMMSSSEMFAMVARTSKK
jgi:hypothetical protein